MVFDRHGLGSPGLWGGARIPSGEEGSDGASAGLRDALEQLGGLYAAFGRFLCWRADLLGAAYIARLRGIKLNLPVVPASAVKSLVRQELGEALANEVLDTMADRAPAWNTLHRTAYHARYRDQPIVIEVARDPVPEESFVEFEKTLRSIGRPELTGIAAPSILLQFREWIRNGQSLARERSFLRVLGQHEGETLVGYPVLIPELCAAKVLCWSVAEGRPVEQLIERGEARAPVLIASAILEQFYNLSMVDGDPELDSMVVDPNGRLHILRLNNPISVLPSLINTGIKYTAAVVAGEVSLSAQTLIRLIIAKPPLDLEKRLIDAFSGVEPELKVHMWFPATAGTFESNWRALTRLVRSRPLFLDCLHRNLVAVGYWNSDTVLAGGPPRDAIADAQRPVVESLLQTQIDMLRSRDAARDWAFGTGLLLFGTLREMNRLAEEVRENDLTVGVDLDDHRPRENGDRRFSYSGLLAVLLLILLATLRWGVQAPGPWSLVLKIVAVAVLLAMFWTVRKIG